MKKALAVILFIPYMLASTGMVVSSYYCCGRLDGIGLSFAPFTLNTSMGGQNSTIAKEAGCCKEVQQLLKNTESQNLPGGFSINSPIAFKITIAGFSLMPVLFPLKMWRYDRTDHAPPLSSSPDLYLRNNIFLI